LKLTPDEVNRFTEAMKKKEFVDMLGDYMKEISDPANKVLLVISEWIWIIFEIAWEGRRASKRNPIGKACDRFLHEINTYIK
jgi:hypothetical protein